MSDTWYRDPLDLPPYEDGFGLLWTLDGQCLNPAPAEPNFLDEWPEELRFTAFQAALSMELEEAFWRHLARTHMPKGWRP